MNARPPGPVDVRLYGNEPSKPYSTATESYHHAFAHHTGTTRREEIFMRVLAGYIAAGSNGMPSAVELVQRAEETTELALQTLARYAE